MSVDTINPDRAASISPDGQLLERFAATGDQEAFALLMKRHGPYLLGVCQRLTFHAPDADDIFQACFLQLAHKARSIRKSSSVAGWLHTIAVRLSKKLRVQRARRQHREAAGSKREATTAPEDITWHEVRQVLEEELAKLPDKLRLPILLCLFQGQTQEEAAHYLDVNPRTLKERLRRGREVLGKRLTRRGVTLAVLGTLLSAGKIDAAVSATLTETTLQAAAAVFNKASLVGVVSPTVLGLAGSASLLAGWTLAAAALTAVLLAGVSYIVWDLTREPEPPLVVAAPQPVEEGPPLIKRSFRGKQFDGALFEFVGPGADKYIRQEEEGLRITLPAAEGPADSVGIKLKHRVRGDFEVLATLDLMHVARPGSPWTAGCTVYFQLGTPERDGVWLGKMAHRQRGLLGGAQQYDPVFDLGQRTWKDGKRVNKFTKVVPTEPATGLARVKIVREGGMFHFYAAEGEDEPLEHLHSEEVNGASVRLLRFAADPVWQPNVSLDVRLVDFEIKADEIVGYVPRP